MAVNKTKHFLEPTIPWAEPREYQPDNCRSGGFRRFHFDLKVENRPKTFRAVFYLIPNC